MTIDPHTHRDWDRAARVAQATSESRRRQHPPQRTRLWLSISVACVLIGGGLIASEITRETVEYPIVWGGVAACAIGYAMLQAWFEGRR